MKNYKMAEALASLPDDLLLEAADVQKKPRGKWLRRIVAAAAALAILVGCWLFLPAGEDGQNSGILAVPGVLRAYAYEVKDSTFVDFQELESYAFVENQILPGQAMWNPFTNYELAITPVVDEECFEPYKICYDVFASQGVLVGNYHNKAKYSSYSSAVMGEKANIDNGETLYWEGHNIKSREQTIYVDIIIKADSHIIGYAIFEITPLKEWGESAYTAIMLKSVSYPMIDGQFQAVSEERVWEDIGNAKQGK